MRTQHQPALFQHPSGKPGFLHSGVGQEAKKSRWSWLRYGRLSPDLHPVHPGYVVCLPGWALRRLWPPDKRGFPRGQRRCLSGGKDPRRSLLPLGVHPLPLPSPNPEKDTDTKNFCHTINIFWFPPTFPMGYQLQNS